MRRQLFIVLALLGLLLSGCSWIEQFVIKNTTSTTIEISYEIQQPIEIFGLFREVPEAFALGNNNGINWEKPVELDDTDTAAHKISVELPPHSVLIFGHLHNQEYEHYQQDFFNGRHFNLVNLTIKSGTESTTISPETFDRYFSKNRGLIGLEI